MLVNEHVQAVVTLVFFFVLSFFFSKNEVITLRKVSSDSLFAFNFKLFSHLFFFFELEYIYVNHSERDRD